MWALSFLAETLSSTPSATIKLLRSSVRPPESSVQRKPEQGWIPAGLQQSQKMKYYRPLGDPLILPQHPQSSTAVSECFHADRCRAGFSLSDLSSSFKNCTAYLQSEPRCLYSIHPHPQNSFRSLRALFGENNLWHCKHCVVLFCIQKKIIMTCEMQLHLICFLSSCLQRKPYLLYLFTSEFYLNIIWRWAFFQLLAISSVNYITGMIPSMNNCHIFLLL